METRSAASTTGRLFLALFVVSLFAHLPVLRQYEADPFSRTPISDALSYDRWAQQIAARGVSAEPVFHQAPLFPLLLSRIDRAFGASARLAVAALVGSALTSLGIALLVYVGKLYFGSSIAGTVAGFVALLHGPFVFHSLKLLPVPIAIATQALALVALGVARRNGTALAAGLAGASCGLASLARSEILLFVPVALVALAWPSAKRLVVASAFVLGLAVGIAPAALHNLGQGDFVLVASSGGENLYIGNKRGAKGDYTPLHPKAGDLFSERVLAREIAEKETGRALRASEVSVFWRKKAVGEALSNPPGWLRLEAKKLARILHPGDPTDIYSFPLERSLYLRSLHAFFLPPWFLIASGVLGVALALRKLPGRAWPVAALAATQLVVLLAFFVNTRLRLPLLFSLAPFAGYALVEGWDAWRAGRRRLLVSVAATLLAAIAVTGGLLTRAEPRDVVRLASVLSTQNRLDEALAVLEPVLSASPRYAMAFDEAGWLLQKKGDLARSVDRYREALAAGMPEGRAAETRTRLAMVLERRGEIEAAAREHDAAVTDPDADAGTYHERGMFRVRTGKRQAGILDLEEAVRRDPSWEAPRRALAGLGGR